MCSLLDLCLNTTYFKYKDGFYRQKQGCAIKSAVSTIRGKLYVEDMEYKALSTFKDTTSSRLFFRYVDDTWVTIATQEAESVDDNVEHRLPFGPSEEDGSLNI